ncbi:MAG: hypothetical protein U0271_20120 [Polyangiaceae bacterium]
MYKRKIVMALLALGTVGGFASGFMSMRCHARARRAAFEDHVADVCVRAAKNAENGRDAASPRVDGDDDGDHHRHRNWGW